MGIVKEQRIDSPATIDKPVRSFRLFTPKRRTTEGWVRVVAIVAGLPLLAIGLFKARHAMGDAHQMALAYVFGGGVLIWGGLRGRFSRF